MSHTPRHYRIAAIGEVLWDVFPTGPRFGGAPANFACTASELGRNSVSVSMISSVGNDSLGEQALDSLAEHGVDTSHVIRSDYETGKVNIELDANGRANYTFAMDTAWDNLPWTESLDSLAPQIDAVCFGSLGQRSDVSRQTIQRFVAAASENASTLRVFDINLRPPFVDERVVLKSLELANVLKLNDEELPWLAARCDLQADDDAALMGKLRDRFQLNVVALTCGEEGAVVLDGKSVSRQRAEVTQLSDTVGAGDAFTAALTLGLLRGRPLDEINATACQLAAYVCSQSGATPSIPERFAIDDGGDS